MKNSIFFKQEKPLPVTVLGSVMVFLVLWFLATESGALSQLITMSLLALLLLGYSISFEVTRDFKNKRHFKLFGFTLFKSKLETVYPDYMVVFSAKYKQRAEWGPVGAMGKERAGDRFVIRFFKGNKHFTLYKTKSEQKAKDKAMALSRLIGVEIRGKK